MAHAAFLTCSYFLRLTLFSVTHRCPLPLLPRLQPGRHHVRAADRLDLLQDAELGLGQQLVPGEKGRREEQ